MSTQLRLEQDIAYAVSCYADHRIVWEEPDRWMIRKPGRTEYWAEIVRLSRGTLLVHGDTDPAMFGHMSDCRRPEDLVHWMARPAPDDSYFVEKASIAMGENADRIIWDRSIARFREEVAELLAEANENDPASPLSEDLAQLQVCSWTDVDIERLQWRLADCRDFDVERMPRGRRISGRMIFAWAAICRLSKLLKEREASP